MSIIKELFNGELYPFEAISSSKEALEAERQLSDYLELVDKMIPKEDEEYFSGKVRYQVTVIQNLLAEQSFEMGFIIAVRLMTKCFDPKIK